MLPTVSGNSNCLAIINNGSLNFFPFSKNKFNEHLVIQNFSSYGELKSVLMSNTSIAVITADDKIIFYFYKEKGLYENDYDNELYSNDSGNESDNFSVNSEDSDNLFKGGKKSKKGKQVKTKTVFIKPKKEVLNLVEPPKKVNGNIVGITCYDDCYFVITDKDEITGFGNNKNNRILFLTTKGDEDVETFSLKKRHYAKPTIYESFLVGKKVSMYGGENEELNEILSEINGKNVVSIDILDTLYFIYLNTNTVRIIGNNINGIINEHTGLINITIEDVYEIIGRENYIVIKTPDKLHYYCNNGVKKLKLAKPSLRVDCGLNYKVSIEDGKLNIVYFKDTIFKKISKSSTTHSGVISSFKDFFDFTIENIGINYFINEFTNIPSIFHEHILNKFKNDNIMDREQLLEFLDILMYLRIMYTSYTNFNEEYEKMFVFKNVKIFGMTSSVNNFQLFCCMLLTVVESYYEKNYGPVPPNENIHKYMKEEIEIVKFKYNINNNSDDEDLLGDKEDDIEENEYSDVDETSSFVSHDFKDNSNEVELPEKLSMKMIQILDFIDSFQTYFLAFENYVQLLKIRRDIEIEEKYIRERTFVDIISFNSYFVAIDSDGESLVFHMSNPITSFKKNKSFK